MTPPRVPPAAAAAPWPPPFERVHRDYAAAVHGIALAAVGPGECEDVVQDIFLAIHEGLGSVREPAALPGWVRSVARNTARDHLRRRGRRPPPSAVDPDALPAPAPSAAVAGEGELARRILDLVLGLPDAYRETLVLRLVEGLSGPQIAARVGLTPDSVRVNLSRGMALLRPRLQEEGWP